MNLTEHALSVLIEESAEIAIHLNQLIQAATKAQRFSLDDGYPGTDRTNRADLVNEANDLIGALEHLSEHEELQGLFDREKIEAKKRRIKEWHLHAINTGALQVNPDDK